MREHADLPAMVGFVRKHVAQHFRANRPGLSPPVSAKLLDAAPAVERFSQHLRAASGALGQSRASLLRRAVRAVELRRNLQVRSCKPDPLGADIVHVGEDGGNRAGVAGRFGCRWFGRRWFGDPGGRVKMFDEKLVHAIVGGKHLDCGTAELSMNLGLTSVILTNLVLTNIGLTNVGLTRVHGCLLLESIILPSRRLIGNDRGKRHSIGHFLF